MDKGFWIFIAGMSVFLLFGLLWIAWAYGFEHGYLEMLQKSCSGIIVEGVSRWECIE